MKGKRISTFRNPAEARIFLENWNAKVQTLNSSFYKKITVKTSFGKTVVWGYNTSVKDLETVVFFPGARTTGLFWDTDNLLASIKKEYRIFIVDVNGQPTLSDGGCPAIKSSDYGIWATEIFHQLNIPYASIVGASLGGLICMKLCLQSPGLVDKAILMNPAGIRSFSLSFKNIFYNFLPIIAPHQKTLGSFLQNIIFYPPHHTVSTGFNSLIAEYLLYALKHHNFKGDLPAPLLRSELNELKNDIYLLLGDKDLLFPCSGTETIAKKEIKSIKEIKVIANVGHAIETSKEAIGILEQILKQKQESNQMV